jgi:hypothetical protein
MEGVPETPSPRPLTSLRIGDLVVVRADDGRLEAEYALFDPGEVMLHATDRLTVREEGYLTTALDARSRLAKLGVTAEIANDAAHALPKDVVLALARSESATRLAERLGPAELFDGATYSAMKGTYAGAWLDLEELARASGAADAPASIQAIGLAALLAEVDDHTPVHLSTAGLTQEKRPGQRTHHRPSISAIRLPRVFAALRASSIRPRSADQPQPSLKAFLLRGVRDRATAAVAAPVRKRIESLENALAADDRMTEKQVAEPRDGYLRAKAALERGDAQLHGIAQMLSELSDPAGSAHDITLLAARAWIAAGDPVRAKAYVQRILDDRDAPQGIRLAALDLLEMGRPSPLGVRRVEVREDKGIPGQSRPPYAEELAAPVAVPRPPTVPRMAAMDGSLSEVVESMALPEGLTDEMLAIGAVARDPKQARIAMTRMAREVARDYRTIYRTILKTDVATIEAMQRHLRRRYAEGQTANADIADELHRHGALLSEIIARRLGGMWVDVTPIDVGYWAMLVPPQTRIWPIGRVFRFFSGGHRERDLVGYYRELEARATQT